MGTSPLGVLILSQVGTQPGGTSQTAVEAPGAGRGEVSRRSRWGDEASLGGQVSRRWWGDAAG